MLAASAEKRTTCVVDWTDQLSKEFPGRRVRVVAAFSGDKDSKVCLSTVLKHAAPDRIHLAEVCGCVRVCILVKRWGNGGKIWCYIVLWR